MPIQSSWFFKSPPRPPPVNVLSWVPIALTAVMNSARSPAKVISPPGPSSSPVRPGSHACTVGALQGEPRGELVAETEDGVVRAGGGDAAGMQSPPVGKLRVDQVARDGGIDANFVGVHGHDG
jgi:hypothetical protein